MTKPIYIASMIGLAVLSCTLEAIPDSVVVETHFMMAMDLRSGEECQLQYKARLSTIGTDNAFIIVVQNGYNPKYYEFTCEDNNPILVQRDDYQYLIRVSEYETKEKREEERKKEERSNYFLQHKKT